MVTRGVDMTWCSQVMFRVQDLLQIKACSWDVTWEAITKILYMNCCFFQSDISIYNLSRRLIRLWRIENLRIILRLIIMIFLREIFVTLSGEASVSVPWTISGSFFLRSAVAMTPKGPLSGFTSCRKFDCGVKTSDLFGFEKNDFLCLAKVDSESFIVGGWEKPLGKSWVFFEKVNSNPYRPCDSDIIVILRWDAYVSLSPSFMSSSPRYTFWTRNVTRTTGLSSAGD